MSDDLVKRLREYAIHMDAWGKEANHDADIVDEAADRIDRLEAALRNIAEGDIPRIVKIPFRDDGQSSKHDRCEHGQWFYEDCGCCIEDYARKALEGKDD
jgi:hypothetical protein